MTSIDDLRKALDRVAAAAATATAVLAEGLPDDISPADLEQAGESASAAGEALDDALFDWSPMARSYLTACRWLLPKLTARIDEVETLWTTDASRGR